MTKYLTQHLRGGEIYLCFRGFSCGFVDLEAVVRQKILSVRTYVTGLLHFMVHRCDKGTGAQG